jgi:hypothetical protein
MRTLVAAIAVLTAAAFASGVAPPHSDAGSAAGIKCAKERWAVKTLTDDDSDKVSLSPKPTTIEKLRHLKVPPGLNESSPRFIPAETITYKVKALLMSVKLEKDGDLHLVIADPRVGGSMIAELPDSSCVGARAHDQMVGARKALSGSCGGTPKKVGALWTLSGHATLAGVAFFDLLHGQGGVAPNGIELHPVVSFASSDCKIESR